jgi:hypothetical protein
LTNGHPTPLCYASRDGPTPSGQHKETTPPVCESALRPPRATDATTMCYPARAPVVNATRTSSPVRPGEPELCQSATRRARPAQPPRAQGAEGLLCLGGAAGKTVPNDASLTGRPHSAFYSSARCTVHHINICRVRNTGLITRP